MYTTMEERNSAIIDLYSKGIPNTVIARKFGLSGARIAQIAATRTTNGTTNMNGNGAAHGPAGNPKGALVTQIKQEIAGLTRLLALAEAL